MCAPQISSDKSLLEKATEDYLDKMDLAADFLELSPLGLTAVDPTGVIRYVNHGLCLMSGWDYSELIGKEVEILVPDLLKENHKNSHRPGYGLDPRSREMNPGNPLRLRHRSGAEIPVAIQLRPKVRAGGMLTLAWVQRLPG